jgi:NMD protein affecting ribosome stability and mRNA decay
VKNSYSHVKLARVNNHSVQITLAIEPKRRVPKVTTFEKGGKYRLSCNHEGRIVWISEDEQTIGVSGVRRSCQNCGKKTSGNWTPTVYLMRLPEATDEKQN